MLSLERKSGNINNYQFAELNPLPEGYEDMLEICKKEHQHHLRIDE